MNERDARIMMLLQEADRYASLTQEAVALAHALPLGLRTERKVLLYEARSFLDTARWAKDEALRLAGS